MSNVLIEQYALFKKQCLEESPYKCLLDSDIDINPHQVEAFCAAIQSLKDGGIVLADEVGLGTIVCADTPEDVREIAKICGGNGGGKPDSAMAGGKDASKIDDALNSVCELVKAQLK